MSAFGPSTYYYPASSVSVMPYPLLDPVQGSSAQTSAPASLPTISSLPTTASDSSRPISMRKAAKYGAEISTAYGLFNLALATSLFWRKGAEFLSKAKPTDKAIYLSGSLLGLPLNLVTHAVRGGVFGALLAYCLNNTPKPVNNGAPQKHPSRFDWDKIWDNMIQKLS